MNQEFEMAVGNVDSLEKGSGARANKDKPDWSLMPLNQIAWLLNRDATTTELDPNVRVSLPMLVGELSFFQQVGDFQAAAQVLKWSVVYLREQMNCDIFGALEEVIAVWEYGKKKYAAFNWMKGMSWSIPVACYMRHLRDLARGEMLDQESGRHHGAHLVCNAMMLVHYVEYFKQGNDLPTRWFELEDVKNGDGKLHRGSK